jgi:predicted ATP-grasp superfamily ATP-dependent carboligase
VLKPVSSHHWRQGSNWEKVGGRKVVGIASEKELRAEYAIVAHADARALLQEMVPGGDDCLRIVACYMDRQSNLAGAFGTHKLLQSPEQFGTGVIVEAADCSELLDPTVRLLKAMRYTGIAEVEYKWDAAAAAYRLIEINPRPWDQHRLGDSCGVSLVYLAYCELAGITLPAVRVGHSPVKWVAEDAFVTAALRAIWSGEGGVRRMFTLARGKRLYAIWCATDPMPLVRFLVMRFLPGLMWTAARSILSRIRLKLRGSSTRIKKDVVYDGCFEKR